MISLSLIPWRWPNAMALLSDKQFAALAVAGGLAAWWLYRKSADVVEAVNPMNRENVFYQGTLSIAKEISGDPDWSLYKQVNGDRDQWISKRIEQIGWERHQAGLPPLSVKEQINQARQEWNDQLPWYDVWNSIELLK